MAASTPAREEQEPTDQAKAQKIQSNIQQYYTSKY
jgi:hypothetical protein